MAFALSIVKLEAALKKPGCPVCRMAHEAAEQSIDSFLWENTNDPRTRQPINDAYGFCPEHTRLLVAKERMTSGPVLGVNIIYGLLAKNVARELQALERAVGDAPALAARLPLRKRKPVLEPKGRCPVCSLQEESAANVLGTLFELFDGAEGEFQATYREADGLCLAHLRQGLELYRGEHPRAAKTLIAETVARLQRQQTEMAEYVRKHNWEYRDEKMTPAEQTAWLHTLTFFTGLPESKFDHKVDEF
jgi:hypothetical protein